VNKESEISHIDYTIPENDLGRKRQFSMFIAKEFALQKITTHGRVHTNGVRHYEAAYLFYLSQLDHIMQCKVWV
jgi:hypothetical protein